jgi:hypothetical protein
MLKNSKIAIKLENLEAKRAKLPPRIIDKVKAGDDPEIFDHVKKAENRDE